MLLNGTGKSIEGTDLGEDWPQGQIEFEVPIRCPGGDGKRAVEYTSVGFMREVWPGVRNTESLGCKWH